MSLLHIDARTALRNAPLFHWLLVPLVAVATLFDGSDTFIPSYMIHFVVRPWRLSGAATGFLAARQHPARGLRAHRRSPVRPGRGIVDPRELERILNRCARHQDSRVADGVGATG